MKLVTALLTWNNLEFFKCAVAQALEFCDEVILSEGCSFSRYPSHSTDGTCEYIDFLDEIQNHPNLRIIDIDYKAFEDMDNVQTQYAVRQKMMDSAKLFVPGNWYTAWDDDQFFHNSTLGKLRQLLETTEYHTLMFYERRFIYNFRFSTIGRGFWRFNRITEGCHLKPLSKLCYKDGSLYLDNKEMCHREELIYFHYPYVKRPDRIKARWEMSIEKGTTASIGKFEEWMAMNWNDDGDMIKNRTIVERMQAQENFHIYEGEHPEILNGHPWRYIDDVRRV